MHEERGKKAIKSSLPTNTQQSLQYESRKKYVEATRQHGPYSHAAMHQRQHLPGAATPYQLHIIWDAVWYKRWALQPSHLRSSVYRMPNNCVKVKRGGYSHRMPASMTIAACTSEIKIILRGQSSLKAHETFFLIRPMRFYFVSFSLGKGRC